MPLVYDELRRLARVYMKGERSDHTLQPTAVVHEAFMRLVDVDRIDWRGKTHFLAVAATEMRRVLVDHVRSGKALKRGADRTKVVLTEEVGFNESATHEFLALDDALDALTEVSPRQGRVAEMRLFAGSTMREIAHSIGVSERTVKEDWKVSRAWLARRLESSRAEIE